MTSAPAGYLDGVPIKAPPTARMDQSGRGARTSGGNTPGAGMAEDWLPVHWRAAAALLLLGGCDSTGPRHTSTYAVLFASATFVDTATEESSACLLSGSWGLPEWPTASRLDSANLHLGRQFQSPAAGSILRDTFLTGLQISWSRIDSTHLSLQFGPPIGSTIVGTLNAPSGQVLTATWPCPPALPLGTDSVLLSHGYQPDSLQPGPLRIDRLIPID